MTQQTDELATPRPEALNSSLTRATVTDPTEIPSEPSYTNPGVSAAASRGRAAIQTMRFQEYNDSDSVTSFDLVNPER